MGARTKIRWAGSSRLGYCRRMAQTREGAVKIAAAVRGMTPTEYEAKLATGEKWCSGCKEWHPVSEFRKDASRGDGLGAQCAAFRNKHYRGVYVPRPRPVRGRSFVPARDGDRLQARRRVNYFVEAGLIPNPSALPCFDCGHVWQPGDPRHEYDHYLGYAAGHHEDVQPVCQPCHEEREKGRRRGERWLSPPPDPTPDQIENAQPCRIPRRAAGRAFAEGRTLVVAGYVPVVRRVIAEIAAGYFDGHFGEGTQARSIRQSRARVTNDRGGRIEPAYRAADLRGYRYDPEGDAAVLVPVYGFWEADGGNLPPAARERGWRPPR